MRLICRYGCFAAGLVLALAHIGNTTPFFEEGVTLGRSFKEAYRSFVEDAKASGLNEQASALSHGHIQDLASYYPEYLERLEGISESSGVPTEDLVKASFVLALGPKCAQSGAAPPATNDGQVYLSWNFESALLARPIFSIPFFSVLEPKNGYKTFFWGIPYLIGVAIMNEKGLSLAASAMNYDDDGTGLTSFELASMAMERCATIPEVTELLGSVPRFSTSDPTFGASINWTFSMADEQGNVAMIEFTHSYLKWDYGENGIVGRANTYQLLPLEKTTCISTSKYFTPDMALACWGADMRALRMWELVRTNYGNIDLEAMKRFTADTNGGTDFLGRPAGSWWTPERHGQTLPEDLARFQGTPYIPIIMDFGYVITHTVFIYEPKRKIIWWTPGHTSRIGHIPLFAGELMGVPGAARIEDYQGPARNAARVVHSFSGVAQALGGSIGLIAGQFFQAINGRDVSPGYPGLYSTQLGSQ
ncbi:MAG: hypothetical protein SVK44_00040 [Nitrospirota bacterium]|nr:hypothetical protein [Nitrospirota bacterium]